MYAKRIHRNSARLRSICAVAMIFSVCLSGCTSELETRWVQQTDTAELWQPKMATLALEVHDEAPGLDVTSIAAKVPNAVVATGVDQGASTADMTTLQRAVLYIGGDEIPTDNSYCQASPALHAVGNSGDGVMMAAALCDGTRLVDTYRRIYSERDIQRDGIAKLADAMKWKLYWGLAIQPATPDPNYNG